MTPTAGCLRSGISRFNCFILLLLLFFFFLLRISVSPHVCFTLDLILISMFLR